MAYVPSNRWTIGITHRKKKLRGNKYRSLKRWRSRNDFIYSSFKMCEVSFLYPSLSSNLYIRTFYPTHPKLTVVIINIVITDNIISIKNNEKNSLSIIFWLISKSCT